MANINDLRFGASAYLYELKEGKSFSATDIRNMQWSHSRWNKCRKSLTFVSMTISPC